MSADYGDVDNWIQTLMACKQLSEADVKKLCDKVWFITVLQQALVQVSNVVLL